MADTPPPEPDPERLKALGDRITALKAAKTPDEGPKGISHTQGELAWRMVIELVAGLLIGFGIGYGLDSWFNTMPVFLLLFVLLGFGGGIRAMLRTAQEVQGAAKAPRDEGADSG